MGASQFKDLVNNAIRLNGASPDISYANAFHPGQPQPTYRFVSHPQEVK
jgi:hypothetical protein